MSKKITFILAVVLFLSKFGSVSAQVVINEFVSDPESGSEWIELRNTSSSEINLEGWNWTELASPGGETEHEGSPKNLTGIIPASGFFVISITNVNGVLNNGGDSIGLYDGTTPKDRVTFGAVSGYQADLEKPAKGKSGALISGSWQTNQEPTRGATNPSYGNNDNNTDDESGDNDDSSSSYSSPTPASSSAKNTVTTPAKIKTEVSVREIAYVGIPLAFQGKVMQGGEQVHGGRYFWNFGDGDFREVKVINVDKFTHTYFYPGEYTVVFEHYPNHFAEEPDASETLNIKVIEPQIIISRVGDVRDFFVELHNLTDYNVDLSGWIFLGNGKSFTIPKNTVIGGNKKMIISGRTSGLAISDLYALKLATPDQKIAFEYSNPLKPPLSARSTKSYPSPDKGRSGGVPETAQITLAEDNISELENLGANVANAGVLGEENTRTSPSSFTLPIIFLGFVGAASYAVYAIRRKKVAPEAGEDFELLDE
ncbi:MAG: lamin tail domain-containing protein [bacterium]|nr:lamin tail domain-containing protein [bacterium]